VPRDLQSDAPVTTSDRTGPELAGEGTLEAAASALAIVSQELMETLRSAHLALEDCVDGRGGTEALVRCGQHLHQARGALRLAETYGAALLTEEMELVCSYLSGLRPGKGREDGLDALTRSMVQLPIYIERLLAGGRDIALVLLPLLNDLRAARGQPLLSESTLLLLNLSPSRKTDGKATREADGENPVSVAIRLRPKFQLALLGWIQGGDARRHLETLSGVAGALERASTRNDMHQLWWVVGAVLESLRDGGLETSVALKRLLGQCDRRMKLLIDKGPESFETNPATDLLNNLLYYVARSSTSGERISEIRAAFNLSELLPGDEQVEHARESLAAPSVKLMQTVAGAIKEDLGRVKDVLDIYVRTGMNKPSELVPQLDLLKKISDTLGVLGLGELRGDIEGEIERLKGVVTKGDGATENTILEIASTLLKVEDRLDQQLLRLIVPAEPLRPGEVAEPGDDDAEYKQVAEAVMRESIINLARIKETFSQSLANGGHSQGVDSVPSLLRGIKAGLLMLNKTRAMEVVDRIGKLILLALQGGGPARLTQKETDRLADAIVSVEYYMETVKAGRREPSYMLDNAETCLTVLRDLESRLTHEKTIDIPVVTDGHPAAELRETGTATEGESALQSTEIIPMPVIAQDAEHLDPELLELFIEEAKEEIVSIKRNLPQWADSPDDMETLITVRRSFHTLKGSGRMVGAERIGEYCWSVENLLNRLINRTLTRTPPMVRFILEAAAVVPELVEQLESGKEPQSPVNLLIAKANAFAEGDPNAGVLTLERQPDAGEAEQVPPLEMDPVLLDIFAKETDGHLRVITEFVAACQGHRPPFRVTDRLHRACHTLHGSANMANVERGIAVAGALNRYVRRAYDYNIGLEQAGIDALRAAGEAIPTIVADINQPGRQRADFAALISQLSALAESIEAPVVEEKAPEPDVSEAEAADTTTLEEPEPGEEEGEYDAEIAAIFSEEAAELLEEADRVLALWSKEKSSREHVEELKRHLHTLKGGARMAGIAPMGNLSHELETLLIGIDEGRIPATPDLDALLQQSIDELHRMRDLVISGKRVMPAAELEQVIHRINEGDFSAAAAFLAHPVETAIEEAVSEDSVAVEFTSEPADAVSMVIVEPTGVAAVEEQETGADAPPPAEEVEKETDALDADAQSVEETTAVELAADIAEGADVLAAAPEEWSGPSGDAMDAPATPEITEEPAAAAEPEVEAERPESAPEAEAEPGAEAQPEVEPEAQADVEPQPEVEPEAEPEARIEPEPEAELEREPEAEPEPPYIPIEPEDRRRELQSAPAESRQEFARIDAELLEDLLNAAGEISIYHSRLSQQVSSIEFHIDELEQTVSRLRQQLRKLEIETEAQIMHGHQDTFTSRDFDPLEMDRYSNIQQLSRALAESSNDLGSLKDLLRTQTSEAETLLVQQSRVTAELQDGLMRTRMVPFQRHVPRLTRLVRQTATEAGKRAELAVEGASGELDRQVLDKMLPPFEHMMRNAVIHGIEKTNERQKKGKPATGRITIRLHREGAEMVIDVSDDGAGLDVQAIRRKAYERGLLKAESKATDEEIMQLILTPGFSTAAKITQGAGRGVGMDVVANEVKKLGGSLQISSVIGQGTNFTVRLPFTLAITQALVVRTGEEIYALPLPTVEGVARIARTELESLLTQSEPKYEYGEQVYRFRHLGLYLGGQPAKFSEDDAYVPIILVRAGDYSAALLVDAMLTSREIVVKSVGPQLAGVRGISGATILGDGSIVLILDINALVRTGAPIVELKGRAPAADVRPLAMVVDDSITVRRVMERFLQRNGMRVVTAKDGLDAISALSENRPDIILLDIEMPRMDGYEFATHVRNDDRVSDVPIIMITSRVGDKHRARAIEIGVNDYLGKPYQDSQLLDAIQRLLEERGILLQ
jgi:chemosensory pili system protein ChpA (sensor histidine kinase/response regulator)